MKTLHRLFSSPVLLAGVTLFVTAATGAAEDVVISRFNDAGELSRWRFDYGGVTNWLNLTDARRQQQPGVRLDEDHLWL
jgi:hypothetical protein